MRDLLKDLEICKVATPGPWFPIIDDGYAVVRVEGSRILEFMFEARSINDEKDAEFIAEAREGWPHAIDRALTAEAERDGLRRELEAALNKAEKWERLSKLQDGLLACYRLGKQPGRLLDELSKARKALGGDPDAT